MRPTAWAFLIQSEVVGLLADCVLGVDFLDAPPLSFGTAISSQMSLRYHQNKVTITFPLTKS
jgi:hypothetical protein